MYTRQQIQQKKRIQSSSSATETNLFGQRTHNEADLTQSQNQQTPDLQTKLETAARFGHNFGRVSVQDTTPAVIQPKLAIGAPGDKYEQEADSVASQVMSMNASASQQSIQRQGTEADEEEVQMKPLGSMITPLVQRQEESEEELQAKPLLQMQSASSDHASDNLENQLSSSKGGGSALPDNVRSFMEPRFGTDFSQVRVHTDSQAIQMNQAVGAQAFTHGSDIYFGAGKSPGVSDLTAHELTHVVQQTGGVQRQLKQPIQAKLTTSVPNNPAEQEADSVANRVMAGEQVKVSQAARADIHGNWLSDAASAVGRGLSAVGDAVGDGLDLRYNEAERDAWEDATKDLKKFTGQSYSTKNFQSTTRLGLFNALYKPTDGTLEIVCNCKFNFTNGSATQFPTAAAADLTWTDEQKTAWKTNFLTSVSNTWSGNHVFHCQKDWWELLKAKVSVRLAEVSSEEHFALSITKIPTGGFRQSSVTSPVPDGSGGYTGGSGDFDSEDMTPTRKPGGTQVGAVHEVGHMLGLDDEYGTGTPDHSDLVQSEFGHGVARGSDGRIMSGGMDIQPEHGVTFLEALKKATNMTEWSAAAKAPRPVPATSAPSAPSGLGDFPQPNSDTRTA